MQFNLNRATERIMTKRCQASLDTACDGTDRFAASQTQGFVNAKLGCNCLGAVALAPYAVTYIKVRVIEILLL